MTPPRSEVLALFHHALDSVDGARVTRASLAGMEGEYAVIALGKSAASMADGARASSDLAIVSGFVALPRGYGTFDAPSGWEVHYGGHPVPDRGSLVAGDALVAWLAALPAELPLVVLMSGGSSACIERLRDGMSLAEVVRRTEGLMDSGADIRKLNAARSEWSQLKQGRALALAGSREVFVRVLADVPGDDPALVGSGPFFSSRLGERLQVIAGNGAAVSAVIDGAEARGHAITRERDVTGDAAKQGAAIGRQLRDADPGVYVWGGETTVALPPDPGRGGRSQHLALAAALELAGNRRVTLLAAGTDGIDGSSGDAGAVVDGGSVARMQADGVDPQDALRRANSNRALAASGDLIHTGPTGTNVMDLVIALVA